MTFHRLTIPGLAPWMSEADYHAETWVERPSLSSSLARTLLNRSPRHAWCEHPLLNLGHRPRHSEAFDIGRACHTLLLGRGAAVHVIDAEDWRGKEARSERDAARAEGLTPMLAHQHEAAQDMAAAVTARLAELGMPIDRERTEIPAYAEIDGVLCRAMIDHAPADARLPLMDLKTCEDASPEACIRSVTGYGYDVQARWYQEVWRAATGESRRLRFVFVEKAPPHEVSVVELHADPDHEADWSADAAAKCAEARRIWRECLESGQWPGFPARVALIGAPGWHRARWADREVGRPVIEKPSADALRAAREFQAP